VNKKLIELGVLEAPGRIYSHPEEEAEEIAARDAYDDLIKDREKRRKEIQTGEDERLAAAGGDEKRMRPPMLKPEEIEARLGKLPARPPSYLYHDKKNDHMWSNCPHPLVAHLPDMPIVKYAWQLNWYAAMMESPEYAKHFAKQVPAAKEPGKITKLILFNFPPQRPHAYEKFVICINRPLTAVQWQLLPWNESDLRHLALDPERSLLLPRLPLDDPRGQGPTSVRRVQAGPIPNGFVWTDGAWNKGGHDLKGTQWAPKGIQKVFKPYPMTREQRHVYLKKSIQAIRSYEAGLLQDRSKLEQLVPHLFGRTLLCWCMEDDVDQTTFCHARLLARYANALGFGLITIRPEEDTA
jgi:hypothetical protein